MIHGVVFTTWWNRSPDKIIPPASGLTLTNQAVCNLPEEPRWAVYVMTVVHTNTACHLHSPRQENIITEANPAYKTHRAGEIVLNPCVAYNTHDLLQSSNEYQYVDVTNMWEWQESPHKEMFISNLFSYNYGVLNYSSDNSISLHT